MGVEEHAVSLFEHACDELYTNIDRFRIYADTYDIVNNRPYGVKEMPELDTFSEKKGIRLLREAYKNAVIVKSIGDICRRNHYCTGISETDIDDMISTAEMIIELKEDLEEKMAECVIEEMEQRRSLKL